MIGVKPLSLPAGIAPGAPPVTIAVSDKAIAIATGKGEETGLAEFLGEAPDHLARRVEENFQRIFGGI